jgi:hypothetical protein
MRNGAILAQIEIPLECGSRQTVLFKPLYQNVVIVYSLAAADDLAISFRREHVYSEG